MAVRCRFEGQTPPDGSLSTFSSWEYTNPVFLEDQLIEACEVDHLWLHGGAKSKDDKRGPPVSWFDLKLPEGSLPLSKLLAGEREPDRSISVIGDGGGGCCAIQ
jgi:hypothetical protein